MVMDVRHNFVGCVVMMVQVLTLRPLGTVHESYKPVTALEYDPHGLLSFGRRFPLEESITNPKSEDFT
ncbi:hypothetical protein G3578_07020 [Brevibacillus sp. SYP-B805]|uniref:hypothetical protein n=1 Tax=Brevibacillus sp. SYP-B805 TaxID=1578199 RepID=UPI0013E9CE00|nr:hypothetical protein [Brevibacillus sp. SYP-B805]